MWRAPSVNVSRLFRAQYCANPETFEASNIVDGSCRATYATGDQCPPGFSADPMIRSDPEIADYFDDMCGTEYNSCLLCYMRGGKTDADCTAALSTVPHEPLWVRNYVTTCASKAAEWNRDAADVCNEEDVTDFASTCCSDGQPMDC